VKQAVEVNRSSAEREGRKRGCLVLAAMVLALAALMVVVTPSTALAGKTRSYTGISFGPDGAAGTETFIDVQSIAVDQSSSDVYVYDAGGSGTVYKFDFAGEPVAFSGLGGSNAIEGIGGAIEPGAEQIAVAPPGSLGGTGGDIYVANNSTVLVYSAAGLPLGTLGEGETCGVAVNPAGHVFIGSFGATIREYIPTENPPANTAEAVVGTVPAFGLCNVAADGSGNIYATNYEGVKTAKLIGLADTNPTFLQPGGRSIGLDPSSGDLFIDRSNTVSQYDANGMPILTFGAGQLSGSFGVAYNSDSDEVYVGNGSDGKVDVFGSLVLLPPEISNEGALEVGLTEAELGGTINPGGLQTTYHIDFGPDSNYGSSTPEIDIGTGEVPVNAEAVLTGLDPARTYHWRLVATSEGQSAFGPDRTFNTFAPSPAPQTDCPNQQFRAGPGARLPDCRAYEQATPVDKHGSNSTTNVNLTEASANGNRIDFGNAAGLPTAGGSSIAAPYLATRTGETWSTNGILPPLPPGQSATTLGWDEEFESVVSSTRSGALFLADTESGTYEQVLSTTEPFFPFLGAFSKDPKHFVIEAKKVLTPGAVANKPNVYDVDHGSVTLVSRIPKGSATTCEDGTGSACEPAPDGAFVGPYNWENNSPEGEGGTQLRYYTQTAISTDGSKVFFTTAENGQLYVRENGSTTRHISVTQAATPDPNGPKPAAFMAATPNGNTVYFTSCENLTDNSTAVATPAASCYEREGFGEHEVYVQGSDLYAYDTSSHKLTDLSIDNTAGDSKGAQVVGMLGATPDGSYVYFAANGRLTPGATAGNCEKIAAAGQQCNIYVFHNGAISFIARIGESVQDGDNWSPRFKAPRAKESRVAANGDLLFASVQNLTGYDSTPQNSACPESAKCTEYYRYAPETRALDCVSCSPANTIPTGTPSLSRSIPGNFTERPEGAFLSRGISAGGDQVFFDTPDKLIAADTNNAVDAYEWEALGSDSCKGEEVEGGCLYLLSTGKGDRNSYIGDTSTNGQSVFIFTSEPLVPIDTDQITDVYDVRVDGGLGSQYPPPPPPCSGIDERCQGLGTSPPEATTPGSSTFSGPGNDKAAPQKPCKKTKSKKSHGKEAKPKKQCKKKKGKKHQGKKKHSKGHGNAGGAK
jgi:hypothetical protein